MAGIKRTGGVRVGNHTTGKPSPVGEYPEWYGHVDFDRDAFTAALANKGYAVTWEKAAYCPNRGAISRREHKINCTLCDGSGFVYFDATDTRMLMTSMNLNQSFNAFGRWDSGTQMVTALPEMRLHPYDKLTLLNGVVRFQELLRRQPGTLRDRPKYTPLCIEYLSWVDRDGALATFEEDVDFTIDSSGFLVWSTQVRRPDDNQLYSIAYTYRPQYVVVELMHQHRDSTIDGVHYEFPVQAMAKLEYLVRDESKDASEDHDQSPFPAR